MKRKFVLAVALAAAAIIASCDNLGTINGLGTSSILAKIDIANATNLFIAPGSASRSIGRVAGDSNVLFKITDDGYVQEVQYIDENGKETRVDNAPSAIYDVNETYVIICFGYNEGYLVRKTDGAVFSLNEAGLPLSIFQNYANAKTVQSDSQGNIYYTVNNPAELIKINTSDPNNLTKVAWVEGYVWPFEVSPAGHIIYSVNNQARIKKANGGFINLSASYFWIGLDNNIKYFAYDANLAHKICTVSIDANFQDTMSSIDCPVIIQSVRFLLRFNDRIISVSNNGGLSSGIVEIENPSNIPCEILIPAMANIKNAVCSNDYYYLSGDNASNQPVLLKVNPKTDDVTELLPPNQYDIYKMTVDNSNVVSFNAERMSDGVKVPQMQLFRTRGVWAKTAIKASPTFGS
jgi:hypothetical protein